MLLTMHDLGICVLVTLRYEGPYLLPWLTHHRLLGAGQIWVYLDERLPNSSVEEHTGLVDAMQQQSWITVVWMKEHGLVNQGQMGTHCRRLTEAKVHWLGIWDVDEILAIGGGVENSSRTDVPVPSLVDYLGRLPAAALVLAIPRLSFLNADVTFPPSADQAVAFTQRTCPAEDSSTGRQPGTFLGRSGKHTWGSFEQKGHWWTGERALVTAGVRNPDGSHVSAVQVKVNASGHFLAVAALSEPLSWPTEDLPKADPRIILQLHH